MKNGVWDIKDVWEVRKGIMKEKLIITDHLISCAGECVRVEEGEKGILIFGETIVRVEELGSFSSILQEGEREILDMRGNYVLPGLIDGHLHLSFSSSSQPLTELYGDDEETCLLRMVRAALMELKSGVTTVRDCGAKGMGILKLRDFIGKGEMQGPDIISAGMPLTITGGHCNFCGLECDTVSEAVKAVRWLCKQGVDYIKVMVSGGNMTPGSDSLIDQYSEETLKAIVEEAHARGKKVSGHVHSTRSIERAIRAGFDVLDHCSFKGEGGEDYRQDLADEMAGRRIAVNPAVGKAYILSPEEAAPLPDKVAMWGEFQQSRFGTTRRMYQSGVPIMAGTDAGCKNTRFDEFYLTLDLMCEKMGMKKEDVLASATWQAARILGLDLKIGSVEPGKQADIVAVKENPLDSMRNLRQVVFVMKRGERVCL